MKIKKTELKAHFEQFALPQTLGFEESVAIPTVRSSKHSRSGAHAWYFLNFKECKGLCVQVSHLDIILPGLKKFAGANPRRYRFFPRLQALFARYHYGFNFLEQIMLLTVPHSVTSLGEGKFIVSLWAYYAYILVDCRKQSVFLCTIEDDEEESGEYVFGSTQWFNAGSSNRYFMTFSMPDSLQKVLDPHHPVKSRVHRINENTGEITELWKGIYSDYMHEILVSSDEKTIVVCDVGRFLDKEGKLIPSRVLVLNQSSVSPWIGSCVENGAHAQFDPQHERVVYFSNHNFLFVHTPWRDLLKKGTYSLDFKGPAAVYKYRIEESGPMLDSVFNHPDMFRLTNNHVFRHRDSKVLAAMGAPAFIFLADASDMSFTRKLEVTQPDPAVPSYIGTFTPSLDGERLYVQTTRSFQVIDLESGTRQFALESPYNHLCSNHSLTCRDTAW